MDELQQRREGRIAVLTLNRPGAGNRLTAAFAIEIAAALRAMQGDREVGACVLTGSSDVFCLGGDFVGAGATEQGQRTYADALLGLDESMIQLGKPLFAAVNGDAHAGGFALMTACDLAIAAEEATFGLPEAAKGLVPFVATAIVKDVLPKSVFFDLVYSARLLTAAEARALNLLHEVVPRAAVLDRAMEWADRAAAYAGDIVKLGRDLYYSARGLERDAALEEARIALLAALAVRAAPPDP